MYICITAQIIDNDYKQQKLPYLKAISLQPVQTNGKGPLHFLHGGTNNAFPSLTWHFP